MNKTIHTVKKGKKIVTYLVFLYSVADLTPQFDHQESMKGAIRKDQEFLKPDIYHCV